MYIYIYKISIDLVNRVRTRYFWVSDLYHWVQYSFRKFKSLLSLPYCIFPDKHLFFLLDRDLLFPGSTPDMSTGIRPSQAEAGGQDTDTGFRDSVIWVISCFGLGCTVAGNWNQEELGLEPRHPVRCGYPNWCVNPLGQSPALGDTVSVSRNHSYLA